MLWLENVHVMIAYDCLKALHAALTLLNVTFVEYLVKGVFYWELDIY